MNNKRTNYLIAILNIIVVITIILTMIFNDDVMSSMMLSSTNEKMISLYGCKLQEILVNNSEMIYMSVCGILAIANIISAIQNRKNKKLFFWQLTFGILILYTGTYSLDLLDYDIEEWSIRIIVGVIPIIFATINIIRTIKNKPTRLEFISYIIAIVIAIVSFMLPKITKLYIWNVTLLYIWNVILIIMQFIYTHKQEKNIDESNAKKLLI